MPDSKSGKEADFTRALREACEKSRSIGYYPAKFEQMLDRHGGVETAKRLIASDEIQSGLKKLAEANRLDWSLERMMLRPEYSDLFLKDHLDAAKWRLEKVSK